MYKVLQIDDNKSDIILTKIAFEKTSFNIEFDSALNGLEGLSKLNAYKNLPNLILTDVNMPKMGGKEFIRKFKSNKLFKNIPIVILSTSNYKKDIDDCYDLKVDKYLIKEKELDDFFLTIKKLATYYLAKQKVVASTQAQYCFI